MFPPRTGGRASTRQRDGLQFDHGCQFVRVRTAADGAGARASDFDEQMQLWQRQGDAWRFHCRGVQTDCREE